MAAMRLGGEKPHQGLPGGNPAPNQVREVCKFTVLLGMRGQVELNRVGSCDTGKERDAESGNDYFGARYYASSMGRFMSPDWAQQIGPIPYADISDPQTLNLYAYAGNNPLAFRDLNGHSHQECSHSSSSDANGNISITTSCTNVLDGWDLQYWRNSFTQKLNSEKANLAALGAVLSRSLGSFGGPRAGKPFTPKGKQQVIQRNAAENGGRNVCENCGQPTTPAEQSQSGVARPGTENAVDHIYPRSLGGDGDPQTNGGLLCSTCNGLKSDTLPTTGAPIEPVAIETPITVEPVIPVEIVPW
jgi:RHS repeat-associated protein